MTEDDLPAVQAWLRRPHVARWWTPQTTAEQEITKYRRRINEAGAPPTVMLTVTWAGDAIGWCQWDAYLKFIEDDFLGGARLDPKTDRRPDPRPDVRENAPILGNLAADFDFTEPPRAPLLLPTNPPTDSPRIPAYFIGQSACLGCTTPPPAVKHGTGSSRRAASSGKTSLSHQ